MNRSECPIQTCSEIPDATWPSEVICETCFRRFTQDLILTFPFTHFATVPKTPSTPRPLGYPLTRLSTYGLDPKHPLGRQRAHQLVPRFLPKPMGLLRNDIKGYVIASILQPFLVKQNKIQVHFKDGCDLCDGDRFLVLASENKFAFESRTWQTVLREHGSSVETKWAVRMGIRGAR